MTFEVDVEDKWSPIGEIKFYWGHKDRGSDFSHIKLPPEALLIPYLIWRRCFKILGRLVKCSLSFIEGIKIEKILLEICNWLEKEKLWGGAFFINNPTDYIS